MEEFCKHFVLFLNKYPFEVSAKLLRHRENRPLWRHEAFRSLINLLGSLLNKYYKGVNRWIVWRVQECAGPLGLLEMAFLIWGSINRTGISAV